VLAARFGLEMVFPVVAGFAVLLLLASAKLDRVTAG
jgi:hypothetical protein